MEETEYTRELTEQEIDDYNSFIEWNNLNDNIDSMDLFLKELKGDVLKNIVKEKLRKIKEI